SPHSRTFLPADPDRRHKLLPTSQFVRPSHIQGTLWPAAALWRRSWDKFRESSEGFKHQVPTSFHARIFFIRFQIKPHQNILMLDGLHVFDVILQAQEIAETEHGKHFYGRFLLANELGFHSFEA